MNETLSQMTATLSSATLSAELILILVCLIAAAVTATYFVAKRRGELEMAGRFATMSNRRYRRLKRDLR